MLAQSCRAGDVDLASASDRPASAALRLIGAVHFHATPSLQQLDAFEEARRRAMNTEERVNARQITPLSALLARVLIAFIRDYEQLSAHRDTVPPLAIWANVLRVLGEIRRRSTGDSDGGVHLRTRGACPRPEQHWMLAFGSIAPPPLATPAQCRAPPLRGARSCTPRACNERSLQLRFFTGLDARRLHQWPVRCAICRWQSVVRPGDATLASCSVRPCHRCVRVPLSRAGNGVCVS
jgi:hypothetical protein